MVNAGPRKLEPVDAIWKHLSINPNPWFGNCFSRDNTNYAKCQFSALLLAGGLMRQRERLGRRDKITGDTRIRTTWTLLPEGLIV